MLTPQTEYERDLFTLRNYLIGDNYHLAVNALDFAPPYHSGLRKDGFTPSFHHQVRGGFSLYDNRASLAQAGLDVDATIAGGILHDTYEENQSLTLAYIASEFNEEIARDCGILSKVRDGVAIPVEEYYHGLLTSPRALIIKLVADRPDNVLTMTSLSPHKMAEYFLDSQHLSAVAKEAIDRYPELEGLIQSARRRIKSELGVYQRLVQMAADGKMDVVVEAFQAAGIISGPREPAFSAPSGKAGLIRLKT